MLLQTDLGWSLKHTFFDIREFNPRVPSNRPHLTCYIQHQEAGLPTESSGSRARFLHSSHHVLHWWSGRHRHRLLQEARLLALFPMMTNPTAVFTIAWFRYSLSFALLHSAVPTLLEATPPNNPLTLYSF